MKNYVVRAIVSVVVFTIVCLLLDLIFGNMHSVWEYAVQAVVFGVLFGLFSYLDNKGWNSWKKVGSLSIGINKLRQHYICYRSFIEFHGNA